MPCVDRDLKDAPRFGRSVEADEDQIIKTLVEANRRITTRKIAANLHDLIKLFFFIKKKKWSFTLAQETKSLSKQSTTFPIARYFQSV